ncbi:MAG: hypothetical protein FK733_14950 [Asgard group archaeon]|nr:hypothetical protein [Asgard group archaeon]
MKLQITTPSRLHFGLLDLNGELGRINGGFGVALEKPSWQIILSDDKVSKNRYELELTKILERLDAKFNKNNITSRKFQIINEIPSHVGFGSGTQFALAIAKLYAEYNHLEFNLRDFAMLVKRGGTSGIGVASFDKGGFILDGGHSFGPNKETDSFKPSAFSSASPPPIIFRYNQQLDWCFIIVTPNEIKGLSGGKELDVFQDQCPIPADHAEKLSRLILMKILPAILEKDIQVLGEGITEMQTKFKRFGMDKYDNTIVSEVLDYLRSNEEIRGSGISSFGPTVFGLVDNKKRAENILNKMKENFNVKDFLIMDSTSINNDGAKFKIL